MKINDPDPIGCLIERWTNEGRTGIQYTHLMDDQAVQRIVAAGCKKYGRDFQQEYDGDSLDIAAQLGLLGEHVYC